MSIRDPFSNPTFLGAAIGAMIGFIIGAPLFFFTGPLVPMILIAGCIFLCTVAGGIISLINDKVDTKTLAKSSSFEVNDDLLNTSTKQVINALNQNGNRVIIEKEILSKPSAVDAFINNISSTVSNWFFSSKNQDIELDDLSKDAEAKRTQVSS